MNITEQFTGLAECYAAHRPTYPPALLEYLARRCALTAGGKVADIGAGTGILTGLLLARGYEVWAVEPNADMRGQAEQALGGAGGLYLCGGTAEDTGLSPKSVTLVTAAQAFHWFDGPRFRAECQRILAPGGMVALIWNSRVSDHPIHRENAELCRAYCPRFRGFSGGLEENLDSIDRFFAPSGYEHTQFPNDQSLDLAGFLGRGLSSSYAPRPEETNYTAYQNALTALFERHSVGGRILLPNRVQCHLGGLGAI